MKVVVDTNVIFGCFKFLESLSKKGVEIIIPQIVFEEARFYGGKGALDKLKKLKNNNSYESRKEQGKFRRGLKFFPKLEKEINNGIWKVKECEEHFFESLKEMINLSKSDIKVLATCLTVKSGEQQDEEVMLLTFDKKMMLMAEKLGINLPRFRRGRFEINL